MPKVMRPVEQEVPNDILDGELRAFIDNFEVPKQTTLDGQDIKPGDVLVPTDATRQSHSIIPGTNVVVAEIVDTTQLLLGASFATTGQIQLNFFAAGSFQSKTAGQSPKKRSRDV